MNLPFALIASLFALAAPATQPVGPPSSPQDANLTQQLAGRVARCDEALKAKPDDVAALQARAESLFRLGRIGAAVRDFDKVVELEPAAMPHNWQRGIALYYAGRFADGARQFERHREVNPQDVENAAWHFLCLSRVPQDKGAAEKGVDQKAKAAQAAKRLIPIEADTRVPLMKVHALYAGRATVEDVLAEAVKGDPEPADRKERLFYAHLYIGLYHEARGEAEQAAKHIAEAATTNGVDGYMGDVARVHAWLAIGAAKKAGGK